MEIKVYSSLNEWEKKVQMKEHMKEIFISLKEKKKNLKALQALYNTVEYYSEFVISPIHHGAVCHSHCPNSNHVKLHQ